MKSAILKDGKVEIIKQNIPNLKTKKGAIIKVHGCGLCGSDIVKIDHNQKNAVLGHEITGEIIDINLKIKGNGADSFFKKGDIIAMGHHYPCGHCKMCDLGHPSMCETFKKSNIFPAGFGEYIYIDEGHLKNTVFKKPDNLSYDEISFLEPLSCCLRAIRRTYDKKEVNVLIIGLGSVGLLMAQGAKTKYDKVYGLDINEERQNFALKYGIKFDSEIKYDAIFMTSGSSKAIQTAIKYAQTGAKIVVFSSVPDESGYSNNEIYYKELQIMGSYSPSPLDLRESYELLRDKKVDVKGLSVFYGLEDINSAVKDTKEGKILKAYIKI